MTSSRNDAISSRSGLVDLAPAPEQVAISAYGVARLARCGDATRWSTQLAAAMEEARSLMVPRIRIAPVSGAAAANLVSPASPVHGIAGSRQAWLYVATIGRALEQRVHEHLRASRYLDGVLLDAAGSVAVEGLADVVQDACDRAPANARFSPGYCGWSLGSQTELLRAIGAAELGVRVLPSQAMQPLKTTTGLVVAGESEELQVAPEVCEACTAPGCTRRLRRGQAREPARSGPGGD